MFKKVGYIQKHNKILLTTDNENSVVEKDLKFSGKDKCYDYGLSMHCVLNKHLSFKKFFKR